MKKLLLALNIILIVISFSCKNSNNFQEGEKALAERKFQLAKDYYLKVGYSDEYYTQAQQKIKLIDNYLDSIAISEANNLLLEKNYYEAFSKVDTLKITHEYYRKSDSLKQIILWQYSNKLLEEKNWSKAFEILQGLYLDYDKRSLIKNGYLQGNCAYPLNKKALTERFKIATANYIDALREIQDWDKILDINYKIDRNIIRNKEQEIINLAKTKLEEIDYSSNNQNSQIYFQGNNTRDYNSEIIEFTKKTFSELANGNISVDGKIDWENFSSNNLNVGAIYNALPNEIEKRNFRNSFISSFYSSFKLVGGDERLLSDWEIVSNEGSEIIIKSSTKNGNVITFDIYEGSSFKLRGINY